METPFFSIITVCKNEKDYIEDTILSVINQSYKNFEFIVIDGVSIDGTLDIIKKYKNSITKFVSEEDSGIYSAMNKAIRMAEGKFLCFINGNDFLYNNEVLESIEKEICKNAEAEFILGESHFIVPQRYNIKNFDKKYETWSLKIVNANIKSGYDIFEHNFINHQSIVYKKELFEKYGLYNENFRIISDNFFNMKCLITHKCKVLYTPIVISKRIAGGIAQSRKKIVKEEDKYIKELFFPIYSRLYKILKIIKYFMPKFYLYFINDFVEKGRQKNRFNLLNE